jgi:hypothetical protein
VSTGTHLGPDTMGTGQCNRAILCNDLHTYEAHVSITLNKTSDLRPHGFGMKRAWELLSVPVLGKTNSADRVKLIPFLVLKAVM